MDKANLKKFKEELLNLKASELLDLEIRRELDEIRLILLDIIKISNSSVRCNFYKINKGGI